MNWQGRTRDALGRVEETLASMEAAASKSVAAAAAGEQTSATSTGLSWRMAMYLRRAVMDAYVQSGHLDDLAREATAKEILQNMSKTSSVSGDNCAEALQKARAVLASTSSDPRRPEWLSQILDLTASLNSSVGADVLQTQDIRLNLDSLHVPERLYSSYWLSALGNIVNITREPLDDLDCKAAVASLLSRTNPGEGGFYDDTNSLFCFLFCPVLC